MKTSNNNEGPIIGRYADILSDRWFQRSFGTNQFKRLTELLLQLLIPEHKIQSICFQPQVHINPNDSDKDIRVDVECTDEDGTRFMVEMQLAPQKDFYERAIFNSSFAIQEQIPKGQEDYQYKPVYFIGVLNFALHEDSDNVLYRYLLRESSSGEIMSTNLQYIFLELPNCERTGDIEDSLINKVCYSMRNMSRMNAIPDGWEKEEIIKLLFSSAEIANFTAQERNKYIHDMTTKRDIENQLVYAAEKGMEKGMEKGIEKGKIDTARNLKDLKVPIDTIIQATGLDAKVIQAL